MALEGDSGTGKSTLLKALAGLSPYQEGSIHLEGRPQHTWDMREYRAHVMYFHQNAALYEGTVEDNLTRLFRWNLHRHTAYDQARALALFQELGRTEAFLRQPVHVLSGGEKQIVALVRGLLLSPRILLLDEPTTAMDARLTEVTIRLLQRWSTQTPRRAYLWCSHDETLRRETCTRRIRLRAPTSQEPPKAPPRPTQQTM